MEYKRWDEKPAQEKYGRVVAVIAFLALLVDLMLVQGGSGPENSSEIVRISQASTAVELLYFVFLGATTNRRWLPIILLTLPVPFIDSGTNSMLPEHGPFQMGDGTAEIAVSDMDPTKQPDYTL